MGKKNVKKPMKVIPDKSAIMWHTYVADKGGCGHIRVIFPTMLSNVERAGSKNIQFHASYGSQFLMEENFYKNKLFIVLQRAATDSQLQIVKHLKNNIFKNTNTQIIYEIDDDLIDIPKWNMAHDYYHKNRENCLAIIRNSFGVTCSTEHLAKKLRKHNKNVKVNPNHLPKFMWGDAKDIRESNGKPKILWSGSSNHFALPGSGLSGGDFGEEFLNFIKKTTDKYEWIFIGAIPNELKEVKDRITHYPWQTPLNYPNFLKSVDVDIGLAPLTQHEFNRSKSNIKAKEYTAAGIPGIYTNITPYENLNLVCNNDEEIIGNIEMLAENDDKRKEVLDSDYNTLKDELFWEDNNNVKKYINNHLSFFNMRLPNED